MQLGVLLGRDLPELLDRPVHPMRQRRVTAAPMNAVDGACLRLVCAAAPPSTPRRTPETSATHVRENPRERHLNLVDAHANPSRDRRRRATRARARAPARRRSAPDENPRATARTRSSARDVATAREQRLQLGRLPGAFGEAEPFEPLDPEPPRGQQNASSLRIAAISSGVAATFESLPSVAMATTTLSPQAMCRSRVPEQAMASSSGCGAIDEYALRPRRRPGRHDSASIGRPQENRSATTARRATTPGRRAALSHASNDIELRSAEAPVLRPPQSIHRKTGRKRNDVNTEGRAAHEPGSAQRRVQSSSRERRARRGCPRPASCALAIAPASKLSCAPRSPAGATMSARNAEVLSSRPRDVHGAVPHGFAIAVREHDVVLARRRRQEAPLHPALSRTVENIASARHRVQSRSKRRPASRDLLETRSADLGAAGCAANDPKRAKGRLARRSHGKPKRRAAKTSGRSGRTSHCSGNNLCQPAAAALDPHRSFGRSERERDAVRSPLRERARHALGQQAAAAKLRRRHRVDGDHRRGDRAVHRIPQRYSAVVKYGRAVDGSEPNVGRARRRTRNFQRQCSSATSCRTDRRASARAHARRHPRRRERRRPCQDAGAESSPAGRRSRGAPALHRGLAPAAPRP